MNTSLEFIIGTNALAYWHKKVGVSREVIDVRIIMRSLQTTIEDLNPSVVTDEEGWCVYIIKKLALPSLMMVTMDLKDFTIISDKLLWLEPCLWSRPRKITTHLPIFMRSSGIRLYTRLQGSHYWPEMAKKPLSHNLLASNARNP